MLQPKVIFDLKKLQARIKDTNHRDDCAQMGLDIILGVKEFREIYHQGDIEYGLMVALEQASHPDPGHVANLPAGDPAIRLGRK